MFGIEKVLKTATKEVQATGGSSNFDVNYLAVEKGGKRWCGYVYTVE